MPVVGNILVCSACGHKHTQINLTTCLKCGHDLGVPNVNMASTQDEIDALQQRYDNAKEEINKKGLSAKLIDFEKYFTVNVSAVINTKLKTLDNWINNNSAYKNYYRAVDENSQTIAIFDHDQMRSVYDSVIFGKYGWDIQYAALTLNEEGLKSYGKCAVILDESSIASRASILEENLYRFVERHDILKNSLKIPKGYRSTWDNKCNLAVAKLYLKLNSTLAQHNYPEIVLISDGNKTKDEFFEVHIYKEISNLAIKKIIIPHPTNKKDGLIVKKIESRLPGKVTIT